VLRLAAQLLLRPVLQVALVVHCHSWMYPIKPSVLSSMYTTLWCVGHILPPKINVFKCLHILYMMFVVWQHVPRHGPVVRLLRQFLQLAPHYRVRQVQLTCV
jgi:hypothetical protein